MSIRPEVTPFVLIALALAACAIVGLQAGAKLSWSVSGWLVGVPAAVLIGYFFWFFRDPERTPPADPSAIISAADGVVARIIELDRPAFEAAAAKAGLQAEELGAFGTGAVTRISIFLSLFDVHVNRMPIDGRSRFLGYFPGKHVFTFDEKSSDVNQHNSILVEGTTTACLVNQIVGPVCRRVVYWLPHDETVNVTKGQDFGMMKFGSRLDMYFPADTVSLSIKVDERVRAGESVIGHLVKAPQQGEME
jgi:phosphatidylserine decarboxylase